MVNDSTPRPPEDEEEEEEEEDGQRDLSPRSHVLAAIDRLEALGAPPATIRKTRAWANKKYKKRGVRIVKDDKAQRRHV